MFVLTCFIYSRPIRKHSVPCVLETSCVLNQIRALQQPPFVILAICGFGFESRSDRSLQFASILSFKNPFAAAKHTRTVCEIGALARGVHEMKQFWIRKVAAKQTKRAHGCLFLLNGLVYKPWDYTDYHLTTLSSFK